MPVAEHGGPVSVARFVERVSPRVLCDHTKYGRMCQILKKIVALANEVTDACTFLFEVIGVALLCGDLSEDDMTTGILTGTRTKGSFGFAHATNVKRRSLHWLMHEVGLLASGLGTAVS